jgi:Zn-dependent metalloprotease
MGLWKFIRTVKRAAPMYQRRGIIPPYILEAIAKNASSEEERRSAQESLDTDMKVRQERAQALLNQPSEVGAGGTKNACGKVNRRIFDAKHGYKTPGSRVRKEGQPETGDDVVDETYANLELFYDFLCKAYQRNSVDNKGLTLEATVHYGKNYRNAFWESIGKRIVLGDGDGKYLQRFSQSTEIIGHEVTHGIIDHTARLYYRNQSGALSESIADVFGTLGKQFSRNQTATQADWLIGDTIFTNIVKGTALRSMKAPGTAFDDPDNKMKDPQPAHMNDYKKLPERSDFGGVHINSGIPNRAFYLASSAIGGYTWQSTGYIWYTTLCDVRLKPHFGFRRFARLTIQNAEKLFGNQSQQALAVQNAWNEVGVSLD